jgi:mannose-6-phosphate isomerase-like protein (cupin superfamily)
MNLRLQDLELLDATREFALCHPHPQIDAFKPALRDWGDDWRAVEPAHLNVTDTLADLVENRIDDCAPIAVELLQTFARHNHRLRWEQSYRKQDGLVPDAMLDGYGFAEIIGLHGPFVSDRIRAGIAVWGPHIDYPRHHHQAEEVYILLSGSAEFSIEGDAPQIYNGGDVVHVESNRWHGLRSCDKNLVVYYLWRAGDLRQTSHFGWTLAAEP